MKIKWFLIYLLAFSLSLPIQGEGLDSGQEQTQVTINIDSVMATPNGVRADITGQNIRELSFSIYRLDPRTGNDIEFIKSVQVPVPSELSASSAASSTVSIPILVAADPKVTYRLSAWGSSTTGENAKWISAPTTRIFQGFSSNVADTISLEFTSDSLWISALTNDPAKLTASWLIQGPEANVPIGIQISETKQNPKVPLSFAVLGKPTGKPGPSLQISLEDPTRGITQQARITLSVSLGEDKQLKDQVNTVKSDPTSSTSKSTRFSWGGLLRTGISAILKYFVI